jgi:acetyl esterase
MTICDARSIPDEVQSSTKDPEIDEWLKTGPVHGAHKPVHVQRREHDAFIDAVMPPIGEIEHLGLRGPHWLFEHAPERGIDPERIALGGDSAGGNMTCTIALKLRDEGGPKLALQMPLYPEAKMPFETRAGVENVSGGYVDTAGVLLFVWCLVPQGADYSQPYITPLNVPSHADLPKALLLTCGFDMLRDVGHAYAKKLAAEGNDITYVHHPDLPQGFIQMTAHSRRCLEATRELAGLLGDAL